MSTVFPINPHAGGPDGDDPDPLMPDVDPREQENSEDTPDGADQGRRADPGRDRRRHVGGPALQLVGPGRHRGGAGRAGLTRSVRRGAMPQ